jgi:hypothetical protein
MENRRTPSISVRVLGQADYDPRSQDEYSPAEAPLEAAPG